MTNEEFEEIFGNVPFENIEKIKKYIQQQLENKDKQIEELIKYIDSNNYVDSEECQFQQDFNTKCIGNNDCKDCIKQYFERKVEDVIKD